MLEADEIENQILSNVPGIEVTKYFSFKFGSPVREYNVGCSKITMTEGDVVYFSFTIGQYSDVIFVTVSDGDPWQVSSFLAFCEYCDAFRDLELNVGHTLATDDEYLEKMGRVGSTFLVPDTLPLLFDLPRSFRAAVSTYHVLLVAFLSQEEYDCKVRDGFDALLDLFTRNGKDLIGIDAIVH